MSTWYKKCMPKVKDIKSHVKNIFKQIKSISGVKSLYVWGSYYRNYNKQNFRVKDIDILIKANFNSGDLISVDNNIINKICTDKYLEEQGYDSSAVKFSKNLNDFLKFNIDPWVISSDKKLLHWGPIIVNKKEADSMNREAEKYALSQTGYNRKKINISASNLRKNWYGHYYHYMNNYFSDMPSGWYQSDEKTTSHIYKKAKKV